MTSHYFSRDPAVESNPSAIRVNLPDIELSLETDRGVFSAAGLDTGTEILLRTIPAPPQHGTLLDLGCGYGAVAVVVGRRAPSASVLGVDVNRRALDLTRRNAERCGALNVAAAEPEEVDSALRFAAIYSNPPVRIGKGALHELLLTWLPRLDTGATAYLVVQRHLGADSLQEWLRSEGFEAERVRSRQGYRVLAVQGKDQS